MSNLVDHATRELALSGVDNDIYGDMTSKAVLELVEVFANQGHSGMSASLVLGLFGEVARFKNLTPLTDSPDEWQDHGNDLWQNKRNSEAFSNDGGATYRLNSEYHWEGDGDNRKRIDGPLHTSLISDTKENT